MKDFKHKVAAISGAASGMGRTLALELARRGCHLSLSDVNEQGLAETAALASQQGVKVTTAKVNVADREAVFAWADQTVRDHGKVNLIFSTTPGWPWGPWSRRFRLRISSGSWASTSGAWSGGRRRFCRT